MNLAQKAIIGTGWVSLFSLITRIVRFLITLVLARLLEPTDFGLVAIGLLVVNTIAIFRDLGVGSALIYQKGDVEKAANTTFILLVPLGLTLFVFSYMISPYAAEFFNNVEAGPVIKYLSITLLLVSLGITPSILLDKELRFKKQFLPEVGSIVSYGIIAIILAFQGYGVWSIVYGKILSLIVWLIIIWVISPWKPKLEFDFDVARNLMGYGKHVLVTSLIVFLLSNLDSGFVGKFLGTATLGFYYMAYNISNMYALNITRMVYRVMFPTFSKLQDNRTTLIRVYLKTVKYLSIISAPISFGILVLAPDIITVVLGEKWMPALGPMQVLCIASLLRAVKASTGILFNAIGRPDIPEKISIYHLIALCVLIYPLSMNYGILGTSIAVTIPIIISTIVGYREVYKELKIGWQKFADIFKTPFISSFFMMAIIYALQMALPGTGLIKLIILSGVGGISYVVLVWLLNRELLDEFKEILSTFKA